MKQKMVLVFIMPLLTSCSIRNHNYDDQIFIKDTNSLDILMCQFSHNIEKIWGFNEILVVGPKNYVKYTDAYQTRSHIDFDNGTITTETIVGNEPTVHLRQAIVKTLLMDDDFETIDSYSSIKNIDFFKEPFLYGQVLDHTGQLIRLEAQATRFADYLLQNNLRRRNNNLNIIYSVTINLVPTHLDKRIHKYLGIVRQASCKYGIDESLILAIIQTESSFNPYAISRSDALGLMQVIQHSAGKDVFRMQGKFGTPSRNYLFDPKNNVEIGTAYLALLSNVYLSKIENPTSRRYAAIIAYHGGIGSMLRIFSHDKIQATKVINNMSPRDVFTTLITCHPSEESRRYLYKVNNAHKYYLRKYLQY